MFVHVHRGSHNPVLCVAELLIDRVLGHREEAVEAAGVVEVSKRGGRGGGS